jgi:hypothetical protein
MSVGGFRECVNEAYATLLSVLAQPTPERQTWRGLLTNVADIAW